MAITDNPDKRKGTFIIEGQRSVRVSAAYVRLLIVGSKMSDSDTTKMQLLANRLKASDRCAYIFL